MFAEGDRKQSQKAWCIFACAEGSGRQSEALEKVRYFTIH
jgi:hypothetical protein